MKIRNLYRFNYVVHVSVCIERGSWSLSLSSSLVCGCARLSVVVWSMRVPQLLLFVSFWKIGLCVYEWVRVRGALSGGCNSSFA